MRSISLPLFLVTLLLAAGCNNSKWGFLRKSQETPPAYGNNPSAQDLVAYMNDNAQQLQSLQCLQVDMDCKYRLQQFHVTGRMVCEKPRNFRLVAEALHKTEADIGSNRDEFWFWIQRNDPPYLVHCSYQALGQGGVRLPFPVQPEWVIEALGMAEYPVDGNYQPVVPTKDHHLELIRNGVSQGRRVQKVTVFDNRPGARVRVRAHLLRDERGQKICAAYIQDVEVINGVVVPRKVDLDYPAERLTMRFKLFDSAGDVVVNRPIDNEQAQLLFSRPNLTGVQSVDLGMSASQVSPAGGFPSQR